MAKLILAQVLKKKKISKRQFAKMLGSNYANVFRFFREDYNPTFVMLQRWAATLDVRIRDLIKE